jgi:hypothetical protein
MRSRRVIGPGALALAAAVAGACQAPRASVEPNAPASRALAAGAPTTIPPVQYLRQLSLDLRGRPPTAAELDQVVSAGQAAPAIIEKMLDEMLASPDFLAQVRDWHAEMLWPNLERYRVKSVSTGAFKRPTYKTPWARTRSAGRRAGSRPIPG